MKKSNVIKRLFAFLLLAYQTNLQAEFDILSPLNFGEIVLTDNSSISTIQVAVDGGYTTNGYIHTLQPGSPAQIYFYNYPAYTHLYFEVNIESPDLTYPLLNAEKFRFEAVTADEYKVTDAVGSALLKIGAILKTTGTGNAKSYVDATYSGSFRINVMFY